MPSAKRIFAIEAGNFLDPRYKNKKIVVTIDITTEKCYILKCNNNGYIKKRQASQKKLRKSYKN